MLLLGAVLLLLITATQVNSRPRTNAQLIETVDGHFYIKYKGKSPFNDDHTLQSRSILPQGSYHESGDYSSPNDRFHYSKAAVEAEARKLLSLRNGNPYGLAEEGDEEVVTGCHGGPANNCSKLSSGACASGWVRNGDRCFFFSRGESIKSFEAGESKCKSRHPSAHLASIHSKQEHDFIVEKSEKIGAVFLGRGTYIGASDGAQEGQWVWSDGTVWDYDNWMPGNPSNTDNAEHCAMVWYSPSNKENNKWNDMNCNGFAGGYACSYNLNVAEDGNEEQDDVTETAVNEEESGESEQSNGYEPVDVGINEVDGNNGVDTEIVAEDGNEDQDDVTEAAVHEEESGESGESNVDEPVDGGINEEVDGKNGVNTEIVAEDGYEGQDDVTEAAVNEEESGESEESNGDEPVVGGINEEVDDNNGVDTEIVAEDGNENQDDGAETDVNEEESGESGESNGEKTVDGEINEEVDGNNGVDIEIVAEDGNEDEDDVTEAAVNEEESGEWEESNGDEPVDGEINEEVDGNNGVDHSYTEIVVEDGNEDQDDVTEAASNETNHDIDDDREIQKITEISVNDALIEAVEENKKDNVQDVEKEDLADGYAEDVTETVAEDSNEAFDEADNPVTEESGVYTEMVPGTGLKVGDETKSRGDEYKTEQDEEVYRKRH